MNSFQALFVIVIIFPLLRVTSCLLEVEEKDVYLVLVAGEPVAFQQANATLYDHGRFHPSDRYSS